MSHNPASSHLFPTSNPLMGGCRELNSLTDLQDALQGCEDALHLLGDLFGSEADDFETLNNARARMGMFWQLRAMAGVLEAINERLGELRRQQIPLPETTKASRAAA